MRSSLQGPLLTQRKTNTQETKSMPAARFFLVFSCTLYFIRASFFVLIVLHFAFCLFFTTQTSVPLAGFEPATPACDRPQTLALDISAAGLGGIRRRDYNTRAASDLYSTATWIGDHRFFLSQLLNVVGCVWFNLKGWSWKMLWFKSQWTLEAACWTSSVHICG